MSYLTKKNNNKNNHKFKNNKFKKLTKSQKGGNSLSKEKFEVQSIRNFDFDRLSLSKYINAEIDWGIMPGPPPKPDCTIL